MPRATQGCAGRRKGFAYWAVTIYGRTFQTAPLAPRPPHGGPTTPGARRHAAGLGWPPFARHYWGDHCCFLFLRVLRCFSSPRWPPAHIQSGMAGIRPAGFSHSGTPGSQAACAYPGTFAACRALRRLREPRHPPCALGHFPSHRRPKRNRAPAFRRAAQRAPRDIGAQPPMKGSATALYMSTCVSHHVKDRFPGRLKSAGDSGE